MMELLVAVCLSGEPAHCKDVSLTFVDEQMTQHQCMLGFGAQAEISKWLVANPKWQLKRWTCIPAGKLAKI
jgi:hypothetical protein